MAFLLRRGEKARKRKVVPQLSRDFQHMASSRTDRLCKLARESRALLMPWADMPEEKLSVFNDPVFDKVLKQHEGVGMLLRMGRFDAKGTGEVTPEEEVRACESRNDWCSCSLPLREPLNNSISNSLFHSLWSSLCSAQAEFLNQIMNLADETLGFLSNSMVISTLVCAIGIPLAIHEITIPPFDSPALGGTEDESFKFYEKWKNPTIMHILHLLELISLAGCIYKSASGPIHSFLLYSTLSIYLPDPESKLRFLVLRRDQLLVSFSQAANAFLFLLLALPFAAAKFSPPASIIMAVPFIAFCRYFMVDCMASIGEPAMYYQHKLARELLEENAQEGENCGDVAGFGDFLPTPKEKGKVWFF